MRLAIFSTTSGQTDPETIHHGFITDAGVFDIAKRSDADLATLLVSPQARRTLAAVCHGTPDHAAADICLLPPILPDAKIVCVGLNYHGHVHETGRDPNARPTLFLRLSDSHVGHGQAMVSPRASEKFDFEGEVAVIIGKPGRHIPVAAALDHVGGYTCYNDGSVRDWQRHSSQFTPGKNFFASGSIGPWIVTADEVTDPETLSITTRLNGAVVQEGRLSQLIFGIPYLVSYISAFTPLRTGDIIATGTPEGVGMARSPPLWMKPGDQVEVEVSGIGSLRNPVSAET